MIENVEQTPVQQEPPYRKKVFDLLSSNFSDFKRSEKEFYDKLDTDPEYYSQVFDVISGNFSDFKRGKDEFRDMLGLKKKEPSVPSAPVSGQPSSVPSPSPSQLPSVFQDLSKGINLRNVSDSPSPTAAIQTRIKANEMAQGGKPTMTVAEKHQKEVEAARKKVDQAIQNSDPILKRMIREGRVFDFERELSKTPTLDGFVNPAINTARKDIILNSPVKPEEIATKKQEALQNDATAREVLRRSAKNNKEVAKSAYLLDAEQRAAENPLKVNDIVQNADKIAAGELRYNIKSGILEKPENPFESIIRGFKERSQQLNDYEAFTTGSDQDVIAKLEKERASYDPDKPVPVADGGTSQFTQMLGMEGVPMVKSAAAAVLTNAMPGGQAAAPYVAAFVSSPEYYKRSYSSALRDAYFELRNKGVREDEALATAKKQAESEGVLGAAEGIVSSAIGARVGLKPTPIVRSSGVKGALENIVRAGGNFIKENAPEGLTDAAVAGALQIAKNVEARDNGLDRDILDGVDDNVVGELMFTFGMGTLIHGGKAVVNDKTYKTIVSALARQPKEAVDAKIGEMVVTGKATPKRAAEIGKEIDEVRAVDSKIPDEVEDVAVRTEIVDKIKQRDELKAKLAKVDEAFHPEIRQEIAKVEDEIKEMSKAPVIEQPAETIVQPEPVKPISDRARSFILGEDETTSNVAEALKPTGIRITELPAAEFEARVKEVGGQGSEEGVFVADNGEIILNKDTASDITKIHEGAHPVMNIIYNTNRGLYDQAIAGMQQAAVNNQGIQGAIEFGQQYEGEATQNDEALVETIARIGTGDIDINTIDTGFKQALIDLVNRIAKVFGFEQVLNDTDVAAFKKLAARVAESLRDGKDISEIVGKENVGRFEVNLGVQSRLRDGEPAVGVDSDKVARERFDIPNLQRLGGGSDRDVFDLGDGNVLKIAKTARGLAQNGAENDWYLSSNGLLPEVVEAGANYIVSKKAEKPTGNKELNKMLAELGKFSQRDFDNKTGELQDALAKYGLEDVLSYDLIWNDFTAKRNWGVIDGKPIHVDGGTYAGVSMLDDYRGVKNLEDSEFRDVYYRSKSAKKQFGDKDKFGQFSKSRLTPEESAIIDQAKANGTYMKAPNGKPTKLNEKQWAQVRTQNFKNWFGDWENDPANASKVVDDNGEPMVVYHGSNTNISEFNKDYSGRNFDQSILGFYFTATEKPPIYGSSAKEYADEAVRNSGGEPNIIPVFLNIKNPQVINSDGWYSSNVAIDKLRNTIKPILDSGERDGVISSPNTIEEGDLVDFIAVATSPNQIKSATDNTGEFNPADNRIQASKSRLEKDKNFKIAAFVIKEKAEGTPDQEIFDGIKSVMPNMSDAEIMSAVSDPEGFIRTKFSNLSSAVQENLISRARVTKTTAPIPQVEAGDQDVILTVRPEDVQAALTEESIMDDFINDAKAVKNKYFDAAQGLPNWIMGIKDITSGVRDLEIRKAVDLSKELKKVAANIGFKDWDTFTKAMKSLTPEAVQVSNSTGIQPWYANIAAQNKFMSMPPAVIPAEVAALPEEIRPYVFAMRGMVDGLTKDLIGAGFVTPEQAQKLESNIGSYLNRAYRLFNEYKYKPSKKDKEEAVTYLANGIINQLKNQYKGSKSYQEISEEAVELANKEVEIILKKNLNPYFKKGEKRDVSILKERKDIPEPIRKLMGEYTDPVTVFVMTVAKQAALRGASQYLTALRNNGIGTMFFEKNDPRRPANFTHEIAGEGSETMSPLNGLFTTPEIAEALEGINPAVNELVSLWTKFVGAVRWGKTVGSVTTQVKNFLSNIGFAVMNGLIYTGKNGKAISSAGKYWSGQITGRKLDDLTQKVMALGLVDQSIGASEIKRLLGTGDMHDIAIELAVTGKAKGMANWIGKPFKALNKAYQLSDDFWKVYAYMNERELVSKAMFGEEYDKLAPEQQVEVDLESSERVKNTWPTYSRVWKGAKYVSENLPIFGNFVSFQAESVRVLGNTFKLAMADIKSGDPAFAAIGYKRLAGMITYVSLRSALTYAAAHAAGIGAAGLMGLFDDDEEKNREEGLRNALPPFMRTGDLLAIPAGDGKYTVYDLSSLDPYGIVFKSLNALTEGREGIVGNKMEPGVAAAMVEFLSGFFEQEMTFKTSMNVANNNNEKTGGQIYAEDMTPSQGWMEVGKYFWNQLKPSTVGMVERLTGDNKIAEVSAVVGARPYEVDLYRSFGRVMSSNSKNFSDIIKDYNAVKYDPKSTQAQKDEAEKKAEERIAYYADKMSRVYRQFVSLGADPKKLNEMIANKSQVKSTGWSKGLKRSIKTGEITPDKYLK